MNASLVRFLRRLVLLLVAGQAMAAFAQVQSPAAAPLVVLTTTLPKAYLRQPYEAKLIADNGTAPVRWEVTAGELPPGVALDADGLFSGTPTATGEFRFTVTATDSGQPATKKAQPLSIVVVAPLLAKWDRYPAVKGQRLEGSIDVSNQTEERFDLTVIVLAVDVATKRATAIGYQHIRLEKDTLNLEIPFGDNLPYGTYQLNADVVAEVASRNSIYRVRLVPKENFEIVQGP